MLEWFLIRKLVRDPELLKINDRKSPHPLIQE